MAGCGFSYRPSARSCALCCAVCCVFQCVVLTCLGVRYLLSMTTHEREVGGLTSTFLGAFCRHTYTQTGQAFPTVPMSLTLPIVATTAHRISWSIACVYSAADHLIARLCAPQLREWFK